MDPVEELEKEIEAEEKASKAKDDFDEESKDKWGEMAEPLIITREDKKRTAPSAAKKRGFYKKSLKRSSATDDIDSITKSKESEVTGTT